MGIKNFRPLGDAPQPFSIKDSIDILEVVSRYVSLQRHGSQFRALCPFHTETEPSFYVFPPNRWHCFGCGDSGDAVDFIQRIEGLTNPYEALDVLAGNGHIQGQPIIPPVEEPVYKGPVAGVVIESWFCSLQTEPTALEWLHARLINDETIARYRLGWHSGKQAITIPYWSGEPGVSEAEVVQLRSLGPEGRYFAIKGHYKKALLGQHLLASTNWVVILFGTFDALLAQQDGLPAISPNGANAFAPGWVRYFGNVRDVVVVPDRDNENELKAAQKVAEYFASKSQVLEFPPGDWGKDYTDYRVSGHSVEQAKALFQRRSF